MLEASFVKSLDVSVPEGPSLTIDIFKDPRTGRYFGVESDYIDTSETVVVSSPYNHMKLNVIAM